MKLRPLVLPVLPPLLACVVQWWLWAYITPYVWFLFYPAVFFSSWLGSLAGGVAATVLAAVLVWYLFIPPQMSFAIEHAQAGISVVVFTATGIAFSLFQERLRRVNRRTVDALDQLRTVNRETETRILERTLELARANETLKDSEARLRAIVENLDEGVGISDLEGQLLQLNRAAVEMHGFADEQDYRRHLAEFADTFELATLDRQVLPVEQWPPARVLRGERVRNVELRIRRIATDWERVYSYGGGIVPDAAGRAMLVMFTVTDVTERKLAEAALHAAKDQAEASERAKTELLDRMNQAQRTAKIGNWDIDLISGAVWWSDEIYRIFELDRDRFSPSVEANARYVHPDDTGPYHAEFERVLRDRDVLDYDVRIIASNGALKYGNAKGQMECDASGKPVRFFGTFHDITDRKLVENELRKFASLAENSLEFIGMSDLQGRVFFVNAAALRLLGLDSLEQATQLPVSEFVYPEDRAFIANDFLPKVLRDGHAEAEVRFRHFGTSEPIWMMYNAFLVRDTDGQPVALATVSRDISARRRAERALLRAKEDLERNVAERTAELLVAKERAETADHLKSEFLAHMSHELRTPLNAILGFAGTLLLKLPGPLTPEQIRQLQTIQSSATHLLALINDLLDVTKIEAGKVEAHFEAIPCQAVVEEVVKTLGDQAKRKGLAFGATMPEQPLMVRADRRMLRQIVINLVGNAIKFTAQGGVRIDVSREEAGPGHGVRISVEDTGIGIRADDQGRLFERFTQLRSSQDATHDGTGLGLHLSRQLAQLLGGEISFRSEHGHGSTFVLTLQEA